MKDAQFERKGHSIKNLETGETKRFTVKPLRGRPVKSINAAKRESRKIQMDADGALGRGTVRLAK